MVGMLVGLGLMLVGLLLTVWQSTRFSFGGMVAGYVLVGVGFVVFLDRLVG